MLNLGQNHSALGAFQPQLLPGALPPALSRGAFAAFNPWEYDREILELGRATWELRMQEEYGSHEAFSTLLAQLPHLGFTFDVLGPMALLVRDEARHVELCRRMVAALGGSGSTPGGADSDRPRPSIPVLRSVMRTVVGSLCIEETLSVRTLAVIREAAEDSLVKEVLTCFASDEARHSAFGWKLLSLLLPDLPEVEREELARALPELLGASERTALESSRREDFFATAWLNPFGFLPRRVRNQVFYDTLECDILARFESLGIAARQAWEARPGR